MTVGRIGGQVCRTTDDDYRGIDGRVAVSMQAGQTSRRRLLWAAAGTMLAVPDAPSRASASQATQQSDEPIARVESPAWSFVLHELQDPYDGEIQAPEEPPPGTRYVATEVEIINDADQALNFTPLDIRLRDEAGVEYRGGVAIGAEPTINPRSLNPGERSRGWTWFIVPEDVQLVEAVYVAPPPQFRVPLAE